MIRECAAIGLLAGFTLASAGCLVMKGTSTDETGVKITSPTLNQIEPGKTTEAWLLAAVGEPTNRRMVDERTSILRYDHSITHASGGTVFLLFAGGEERRESSAVVFEVTDGVITRYWTES